MQNDALATVIGQPPEEVTHWGIARIVNGKSMRLDHPNANNVRVDRWPVAELSLDEVRARWGHGTFKVLWLNPESDDPHRRSGGWSAAFTLDPEKAVATFPAPTPTMPAVAPPLAMPIAAQNGVSAGDLLNTMTQMMQMSDARSDAFLKAVLTVQGASHQRPAEENRELSELRAAHAALAARIEADEKRRELEQRHRDELAKKDAEIAKLAREKEEAEREAREAERAEPPRIDPGSPILSQIGFGLMNAAMAKPELVGKVLEVAGPFVEKLMGGGAVAAPPAKAPPNGVPAPRAMPEVGQPPVRPPVVPVVRAGEQPPPARTPEPPVVVPPLDDEAPVVADAVPGVGVWEPIGNATKNVEPPATEPAPVVEAKPEKPKKALRAIDAAAKRAAKRGEISKVPEDMISPDAG